MTTEDYRDLMAAAAAAHGLNPPAIVQPSSRFLTVNSIRLHYLDWGNPQLPHVILIHGAGLTAHSWDMAALLLRDRYHLVAVDLRGHGDSGWAPDPSENLDTNVLEDLTELFDALGYERFSLVGMSRGGMIAVRYVDRHPERVDALVLVDITPEASGIRGRRALRKGPEVYERFDDVVVEALKNNVRTPPDYLRYILHHSVQQLPDGRWTWKEDRRPNPHSRNEGWTAPHNRAALREMMQRFRTPMLLIRGESSPLVAEADAQRTVEVMADARYVTVRNAGHSVQTNNPKDFAAYLDEFLAERVISIGDAAAAN